MDWRHLKPIKKSLVGGGEWQTKFNVSSWLRSQSQSHKRVRESLSEPELDNTRVKNRVSILRYEILPWVRVHTEKDFFKAAYSRRTWIDWMSLKSELWQGSRVKSFVSSPEDVAHVGAGDNLQTALIVGVYQRTPCLRWTFPRPWCGDHRLCANAYSSRDQGQRAS